MSWHTARSHFKNLMRKTGCHRQVELVRLLQSLQPADGLVAHTENGARRLNWD